MKQNQKHTLIVLLCLVTLVALCLTFAACNKTYSVKIANYDKAQGSVTLSPESQDGQYKEGTELTVTVKPVDGYAVESFKLGSEEKVGELNSEGKFVFKVQQDTTITVTFKSTTVAVESVSLNKQSLSVHVTKQDDTLTAQVLPENATDKTVTWTSSVPAVATVDNNGKITAVAAGETVITATAGDGKTATCTVTVTDHQLTTVSAGESGHKSVCGVDGCGYESEVAAHSLKINSDKTKFECEQCEYEENHTHSLSYKSTDGEQHTISCTVEGCGYTSTAKHSLKINSAKDKFECEQCEYEVAHNHDIKVESAGVSGHKEVCKTEGCGYEGAVSAHSLKINSDKTKFECEQCEYEVAHTHTLSYKSTGSEQHTVSCTVEGCGYTSTANHSLKINSDKTKFECEQCEYEVAHSHALETKSAGESGHKEVCKTEGCGYEGAVSAHSLKINSDKTKFECEQCEYEVAHSHDLETKSAGESGHKEVCKTEGCGYEGEVKSHNLDPEYASDGNQGHHTNCLDCDYVTETVAHVNSSGVYENAGAGGHTYRCDICEALVKEQHHYRTDYSSPDGEYQVCDANGCTYKARFRDHNLKLVFDADSHHEECQNSNCTYKTEPIKCEESGQVVYTADSAAPESGHRGKCICGNELALEAHDQLGDNKACSKCGYLKTDEHEEIDTADEYGYYDGVCDICGKNYNNTWTFDLQTRAITKYNGNYKKLRIPDKIDGISVEVIQGSQNSGCFNNNATITNVIIPRECNITELPAGMFSGCSNLNTLIILAQVTDIPTDFLMLCTNFDWLVLPETIKTINSGAFGIGFEGFDATLNTIYFLGTQDQWQLIDITGVLTQPKQVLFYKAESGNDTEWHWETDQILPKPWKEM